MQKLKPGAGGEIRIVLRPPVSVGGILADSEGRPLKKVKVRVARFAETRVGGITLAGPWEAESIPEPGAATTDDDGAWVVRGLVAGGGYTTIVEVGGRDYGYGETQFLADADGTPLDLGLVTLSQGPAAGEARP